MASDNIGRPTRISDPEFAKIVAAAYLDGMSRREAAATFGVHPDTYSNWCRDPRVRAHAARMAEDRMMRILRRTDKVIEAKLQNSEEMDVSTLLRIRAEFAKTIHGNNSKKIEGADDATINETAAALDEDPGLMSELREFLENN